MIALNTDETHAIIRRALAFAATLKWESPSVLSAVPASEDVVATYGTPGHSNYMAVTIIMQWSLSAREHILATVAPVDRPDTERILESPLTVVVTCSDTDIIHHYFPGVDLD